MVLQRWGNILVWCFVLLNFSNVLCENDSCSDRKGRRVAQGEQYPPYSDDPCVTCICQNGQPRQCITIMCQAPTCSNYQPDPERCCGYLCLEPDVPDQMNTEVNATIKVTIGSRVHLKCPLHNPEGLPNSWARNGKVLTMGLTRLTRDERYRPLKPRGSTVSHLVIDGVEQADQGIFECRIQSQAPYVVELLINDANTSINKRSPSEEAPDSSPYFEDTPTNVAVRAGHLAILPCKVHHLKDYLVMWKLGHIIISLSEFMVISNSRFSVSHSSPTDWDLKIDNVQPSDSGVYSCAISTHPQLWLPITLEVYDKRDKQRKRREVEEEEVGNRDKFPYFDNSTSLNITTTSGTTAYLPCRVRHLGDRTVSWIRKKDLHVLTVGKFTYTNDARFQTLHLDNSDDWTLQIKYTQHKDAGLYECQVSTVPKMSHFVMLNVIVSKAEIQGGPTLYINSGSTLTLTCEVAGGPEPPVYVFWYHDGRAINYGARRGILATVERGPVTTSRLTVPRAGPQDSGSYSCVPSNAEQAMITVHVLNGPSNAREDSQELVENR